MLLTSKNEIERLVAKFDSNMQNCDVSNGFAVAVSGGLDSIALAMLAQLWALRHNVRVVALTVDHGLRIEAKEEAEKVGTWLNKRDMEHHVLTWRAPYKDANVQAQARMARYTMMTDFCKSRNIDNLLVAHHLEDQAETVLLRLMRGSGVDGLSGMNFVSIYNDVRILRPLLDTSRDVLKKYLLENKQEWVEDPSNKDTKYARVNVRNFLDSVDDKELLVQRLANTAAHMRRTSEYVDQQVTSVIGKVVNVYPEGYCVLNIHNFVELHPELGYRIMARVIKCVGGNYYKPRFEKLDHLYERIVNGSLTSGCTLGGTEIIMSVDTQSLVFIREINATEEPVMLLPNSTVKWDERFMFSVGNILADDLNVSALGEQGFAEIKDSVNSTLVKKIIYGLPTLRSGETILAVPHLGYGRMLDEVAVSPVLLPDTFNG